ncbi:MAG: hypothetical protein GF365_05485 [Candidatus Buchananbacteria bacterium]|nr:hypothetical protein [Candidatus Buchananbacteria bacterium]
MLILKILVIKEVIFVAEKANRYYLKLLSFGRRLFFKSNSIIIVREWPLFLLLQIIFLRRDYIRNVCCYCQKTLGFNRSSRTGDSGDMCLPCLFKQHPDIYFDMKEAGQLSQEKIDEAEKPLLIKP